MPKACEKMENNNKKFYFDKFTTILFSRIIFKKLDNECSTVFRKLEKGLKSYIKLKADICFLKDYFWEIYCWFHM